jgi:citrate synthase
MTKEAFRLTSPSGVEMDLPVRSGTVGPDVIDVGKLYKEQGVFTDDPGFGSTGS